MVKMGVDKPPHLWYNTDRKEVNEMNNFLFEDHIDGGFFFVQCDTLDEAYEIILDEVCDHVCVDRDTVMMDYDYLGCYSDAEAEIMGYDTY